MMELGIGWRRESFRERSKRERGFGVKMGKGVETPLLLSRRGAWAATFRRLGAQRPEADFLSAQAWAPGFHCLGARPPLPRCQDSAA